MPSSSAHNRDRRDRHRASYLPRLEIPEEDVDQTQSPSPRSELLSSTSTDVHHGHSQSGHGTSYRKHRRHESRSSGKHSSGQSSRRDRSKRGTDMSSVSHRELLDTIAHSDDLDRQLHKTLEATVRRLEEEARKARELERITKETAQKFIEVNEGRLHAQREASEASRALREEQLRLEEAKKEIERARNLVKDLARQKEEAEQSAARARAKARKLQQRQLVMQAREEGRKMGFEAGIKQAQEEYESIAPFHPPATSHHRRGPSPPPESSSDNEDGYEEGDRQQNPYEEGDTMRTDDIRSPAPQPRRDPVLAPPHPPPAPEPTPLPPPPPHTTQPSPRLAPPRALSPAPTIPVENYTISIPAPDGIVNAKEQPRDQWVTAQKHKEITGGGTSPHTTPRIPLRRDLSSEPMPESLAIPPDLARQVQETGKPVMIYPQGSHPGFPTGQYNQAMHQGVPPTSAPVKKTRFPSLAKTKSKAASWYRSLSLRRKNKPVIDPDDEPQSAITATHYNGPPGEFEGDDPRMYASQPKVPQKWYVPPPPKSVKSRHSRAQSAFMEQPSGAANHRHSRASTSISQFGMVNSAPEGYRGDIGSISGRSTARNLAQKLSSIQEDPLNRTSQGNKYVGGIAGYGAPMPAPNFGAPGSDIGSTRTGRRRPPEITVQNPNGLANSAVQIGQGGPPQPPAVPSALSRSTSNSGDINIDIQPATAAPLPSAGVARRMTQNHLTPNYKPLYAQSITSHRSRASAQGGAHKITQSYSEPLRASPKPDTRSIRSGHSRSQSAAVPNRSLDVPNVNARPSESGSRPRSVAHGMNPTGSASQLLDPGQKVVQRSPSKSSMHSKYDPTTYLDPAYFPDLTGKAPSRHMTPSPGLEYVDPPR